MANETIKQPAQPGFSSSRDYQKSKPELPGYQPISTAPNTMPSNGRHYVVLCDLPNGLICQVGNKRIKLKGSAHYLIPATQAQKFKGQQPHEAIYGATISYVDKDFWDAWVVQMTDRVKYPDGFGPITNGQIIWHQHKDEATLIRKDGEGITSGFEQLVPDKFGVKKDSQAGSNSGNIPRIVG